MTRAFIALGLVLAFALPATADSHRGRWYQSVEDAEYELETTTLYPGGYYYGEILYLVQADCIGGREVPPIYSGRKPYFKHLLCGATDAYGRRWFLVFHPTGSSSNAWTSTDLTCAKNGRRARCP